MSIEDQTLPQDASEKLPNVHVNPWPLTAFDNGAAYTGAAVVPVGDLIATFDDSIVGAVVLPRPRCDIRLREPSGVRPRGVTCHTCGAQANGTDAVQCKA